MKRIYSFCTVVILSLLTGCKEEKEVLFSEKVFNISNSVLIREEGLLDPWDILLIDSVLVIANNKGEPLIETYNMKGFLLQKFLSKGQGPEEISQIGDLLCVDHNLFVFDLFQRKFLEYDYINLITGSASKPDNIYRFSFIERDSVWFITKLMIGGDFLIGIMAGSGSRINLYDFDGKK
jgi:hypothetical protein